LQRLLFLQNFKKIIKVGNIITNDTKQVIVIRKDLKMRKGKMVAQGAHASMKAVIDEGEFDKMDWGGGDTDPQLIITLSEDMNAWLIGLFTKICVSVDSEEELLTIYEQAKEAGLHCSLIQDAGLTEFDGVPTYTAVAVGPASREDCDKITGNLPLL